MYNVQPFVPRIKEITLDDVSTYASIEDYFSKRKVRSTGDKPAVKCSRCEKTYYSHKEAKNGDCVRLEYKPNYDNRSKLLESKDSFEWYRTLNKAGYVVEPKGHSLYPIAKVVTELGDPVDFDAIRGSYKYTPWPGFYAKHRDPENRGLLPFEREHNSYLARFKHYPAHVVFSNWHRKPKTLQERKFATDKSVCEFTPKIRGARSASSLPNAWDDKWAHRDRTWKRKKVKKQWMINL